ncbi:hypothetical protein ARMGADRAFT_910698 [Armillaria gallica]|uniref:Tc1-like transposase DDE domain-containing protein n=1 Tax=Armillaria gallica TaxID=47427 RepID=A0A2H3F1V3_ARMGA|nr:hypothetical protein ARMGADRAFT_910698 [Armillaria gallica]
MWCVQHRHFICGKQYSILLILTLNGIIAYDILPGSVTSEKFVDFFKNPIPLTNPFSGLHSVLLVDNCSIHHSEKV